MYAYSYGEQHFNFLYTSTNFITVFSDNVKLEQEEEDMFIAGDYVLVEPLDDGRYAVLADYLSSNFVAQLERTGSIQPANLAAPLSEDLDWSVFNSTYSQDSSPTVVGELSLHTFDSRLYLSLGFSLDETVVTSPSIGRNRIGKIPPLAVADDYFREKKLSIFFFVSNDGAKIERAFQQIDKVLDNELIFFLEQGGGTNLYGSVLRIKSGSKFNSAENLPKAELRKLINSLGSEKASTIFKAYNSHIKNKDESRSLIYILGSWFIKDAVDVLTFPAKATSKTFAGALDQVVEFINKGRIDEKRWQYYAKDGSLNAQFDPFFPKSLLEFDANTQDSLKDVFAPRIDLLYKGIDNLLEQRLKALFPELANSLQRRLKSIQQGAQAVAQLMDNALQQALTGAKDILLFYNALVIGLWNSLIDLVNSIFELLSMLFKIQDSVARNAPDSLSKLASSISLAFELHENFLDFQIVILSKESRAAIATFFDEAYTMAVEFISTITPDRVGYYIGYAIGFIIEEVLLAIATGTARTASEILRVAAKTLEDLVNFVKTVSTTVSRGARKITVTSIDGIVGLGNLVLRLADPKNLKQLFDALLQWLREAYFKLQVTLLVNVNGIERTLQVSILPLKELFELTGKVLTAKNRQRISELGVKFGRNAENPELFDILLKNPQNELFNLVTLNKLELDQLLENLISNNYKDANKFLNDLRFKNLSKVPSVKLFQEWFDNISISDFDKIWDIEFKKNQIKRRLRHPGGLHEWLMVSRANVFKKWGISARKIKELRTDIDKVIFVNPDGFHGGPKSTEAHNEILFLIDNSNNFDEFSTKLLKWADRRLPNGRKDLPSGFNIK